MKQPRRRWILEESSRALRSTPLLTPSHTYLVKLVDIAMKRCCCNCSLEIPIFGRRRTSDGTGMKSRGGPELSLTNRDPLSSALLDRNARQHVLRIDQTPWPGTLVQS